MTIVGFDGCEAEDGLPYVQIKAAGVGAERALCLARPST